MAEQFTPDLKGIQRLKGTPEMVAAVAGNAEAIKDMASVLAPKRKSATYVRGLSVESGVVDGVATAHVNADKHAVVVEFGTSDTPRFRPLGRALDALREE